MTDRNNAANLPSLVFIHGGCHSSESWRETLAALRARRPDVSAFAIDLPGRGEINGDLATLTVDACVESVVEQIESRVGSGTPVVLIGHSMAGVIIPRVVDRLGDSRVQRVISVACNMPPAGKSILDNLPPIVRVLASQVLRTPVIERVPSGISRFIFGNKATGAQRARIRQCACRESKALLTTKVEDYESLATIPVGWVLPMSDRACPPRRQRASMSALKSVDRVATVDAGHEVLITHPDEVARHILVMVDQYAPDRNQVSDK